MSKPKVARERHGGKVWNERETIKVKIKWGVGSDYWGT